MTDDIRGIFEPSAGAAVSVITERLDSVLLALDANVWTAIRAGDCWNDMVAVAVGVPRGLSPSELAVFANGRSCQFRAGPVLAVLVPADASTLKVHTDAGTVSIQIKDL